MYCRPVRRALLLLLLVAPGSAHAGRTFYGWLYGTEVMPERGAELQSWLTEENKSDGPMETHETSWLVSGVIGVTDRLELDFPVEVQWSHDEPSSAKTALSSYGAEARYRFVSQDPVDAPPFAPLVRLSVERLVTLRNTVR